MKPTERPPDKRCAKHNGGKGAMLPISEFYKDASDPRGLSNYCKECSREVRRKTYAAVGPTLRQRFTNLERRALRVNGAFNLSFEEYLELQCGRCAYGDGKPPRVTIVIDRKEPDLGYTKGNCVSACQRHNQIKGKWLSFESMLRIVKEFPETTECGDLRTAPRKFEPSQARQTHNGRPRLPDHLLKRPRSPKT